MSNTLNGSLARDENDYPVMGGTSSLDNKTIINSAYDPDTRQLLVDSSGGSSGITIGTTAITGGTDKSILYDDDGVVGEFTPTASELLATDGSNNIQSLATATYPSLTELSYVKGVTSAIQTQLNAKGAGTVTTVSVATANGFSGSSSGGATPSLTIVAGAITPTSVNGLTITTTTGTLTVTGSKVLTISNTLTLAGTDSTTMTFPSTSQTIVGLTATQTLTNKTITDTTNVLGGVTMTLGSDASYDIYYRNSSGYLTRLANGTTGQVLTATTSNAPSWGSSSSVTSTSGVTTHVASSTTTTTIAHGLGRTPVKVNIQGQSRGGGGINISSGVMTASGNFAIAIGNGASFSTSSYSAFLADNSTNYLGGVITVDATNITITWTKVGSPSYTYDIQWSVI